MPPVLESDMHSREYLAEQKRKGEAYLKERDARIAERKAAERQSLKDIQSLARSLVYPSASNAQPTQNTRGADDRSDSEYEPDAEEEAHAEEEDLRDEEKVAVAKSKAMAPEGSTMPKTKKRVRSKNSAAATSRITRSRATATTQSIQATNHQEQSAPNPTNTSPHLTSKDSNSLDADSGVQGSQDMIGTSGQSDNMITLQGQDALACSTGPTDPRPSRRGRGRRPTMGHGHQEYASRNGGRKMRIDFTAGKVRPTDPVQAAKLSSECGIHIRSRMHVARHWNDYAKSPLKHVIPHAIKDIALNFEMEKDDKVGNDVCTKVIQKGVRQQRYRLKKKYFNGYTAQEALSNKPANITHENWTSLVNKSDERNKKICQMNKENREAVKHHQKTGSMSYVAYFSKLKKDKYNNQDPSPIEFFKDTHTNSKTGSMSEPALLAHNAMEKKEKHNQKVSSQYSIQRLWLKF
ncbi:uncharacterized protein [Aegilops tauschii subsp. strangulata]|uniref:uncharacterized protein n=1 Tax=Aegilops tauschii subsp. strangulata TaxID=200361 RepID=UPI00098B6399|nr:uncharacterized protein LOC109759127 isoform X2 [Aegilops tauschii subsp. strangulata]